MTTKSDLGPITKALLIGALIVFGWMAVPRPPQETQQAQPRAESLSSEEQEVRDHLRGVLGLDEGEKLFRRLLEDARRNGGSVKSSLEGVEAWMRAQQAFEESKPLPGQPYFVLHQGGSAWGMFRTLEQCLQARDRSMSGECKFIRP